MIFGLNSDLCNFGLAFIILYFFNCLLEVGAKHKGLPQTVVDLKIVKRKIIILDIYEDSKHPFNKQLNERD